MGEFKRESEILESADGMLFFECLGCKMLHGINVSRDDRPRWDWDGSVTAPTFSPSILVRFPWGPEQREVVCHSYVRGGQIQYLDDCTHEYAGKTIPLPPISEDM